MTESKLRMSRRRFLKNGALGVGGLFINSWLNKSTQLPQEPDFISSRSPARSDLVGFSPNPTLAKLGFTDQDRVLIIQADNLGICQSNFDAFNELADIGSVSSSTVVIPGVWFPLAAHYARTHPSADIGVCLTLTSPYDAIRWRPLSTADSKSGCIDSAGYMPKKAADNYSQAVRDAIGKEVEAQIQRSISMGIRPTHLDSFQESLFNPLLFSDYVKISSRYRLPLTAVRANKTALAALPGVKEEWILGLQSVLQQLEAQEYPLFDGILTSQNFPIKNRGGAIKSLLGAQEPGLYLVKISPAKDTPELRAMTGDWENWVADFEAWKDAKLQKDLKSAGIKVIGWSQVQAITPEV